DDAVTTPLQLRRHDFHSGGSQIGYQLLEAGMAVLVIRNHPAQLRRVNQELNAPVRNVATPFGYVQNGLDDIGMALPKPAGYTASAKTCFHPLSYTFLGTLARLIDHYAGLQCRAGRGNSVTSLHRRLCQRTSALLARDVSAAQVQQV